MEDIGSLRSNLDSLHDALKKNENPSLGAILGRIVTWKTTKSNITIVKELISLAEQGELGRNNKKMVVDAVRNWSHFEMLDSKTRKVVHAMAKQLHLEKSSTRPPWFIALEEFFRTVKY